MLVSADSCTQWYPEIVETSLNRNPVEDVSNPTQARLFSPFVRSLVIQSLCPVHLFCFVRLAVSSFVVRETNTPTDAQAHTMNAAVQRLERLVCIRGINRPRPTNQVTYNAATSCFQCCQQPHLNLPTAKLSAVGDGEQRNTSRRHAAASSWGRVCDRRRRPPMRVHVLWLPVAGG